MTDHLPEVVIRDRYHLPECWKNLCETCDSDACPPCICTPLRACEQRMLDDDVLAAAYHGEKGYAMGYAVALNAAEAAVAELFYSTPLPPYADEAVSAIRALKEKP